MTAAVLTPFTATTAVELGNRLWRKKLLPVGDVEYKGRTLHFTRDYLGRLVQAFQGRAYDQVPFQLADAQNTHTNDPERTRGWVKGMELGDDGLYVTAEVNEAGEQVLTANPQLGVSARIVEDYARSDGRHFPAAVQHVLGTLDPRIPGLGAWEAIEAATPEPDQVIDLSGLLFAGDPGVIDLDWATWDASHGSGGSASKTAHDTASATASRTARRDAMAKDAARHDRGGSDEEKAANHVADAKKAAQSGQHTTAMQHLARATQLSGNPDVYAQASKLSKGVKQMAQQAGNTSAASWTTLSNEGTDAVPDLNSLTGEQQAKLAKLLNLDDDTLDALAAGGVVVTPEELDALTAPDDGGDAGGLADEIDGMSDDEIDALQAEFDAEFNDDAGDGAETIPEGEPVAAGMSAEAQFAIDLANAKADETARELAVVTARLREEDFQAEKRRMADLGVPPYITELARPLLEGAGHAVELANGRTVDAGAIMRRVLSEYASQARLLDLDVELGSPHDEPEDAAREQQAESRDALVGRFKSMTGL